MNNESISSSKDAMQPNVESQKPEWGFRNKKGEWRPPYPVTNAPLFTWPLKPLKSIKWLLSFPGFLWPWNSVFLLITLATWFYFQPELSRCTEFNVGWIGQMYFRNLVLLWLTAGG